MIRIFNALAKAPSTAKAKAMSNGVTVRSDYRRNDAAPQWDVVLKDVLGPLTDLREQVADELARKSGEDPLAPIDKEAVPEGYEDLVRKYYESLGEGRRKQPAQ